MWELLPPAHLWLPAMLAMLCLMLASGFFSACETALFYLSRDELRAFRVGGSNERIAAALLSDPERLMTGLLFWNLLVNLCYFAVSIVMAQRLVAAGETAFAAVSGLITVSAITLFGEVAPKSAAVVFRRTIATACAWPLAFAVRLLDPIIPVLQRISLLVRRTFWPNVEAEPYLHAEDLERAVENSELGEAAVQQEREVLHSILDLSEMTVEEIMRPRGTYVSLPPPIHLADLRREVPPGDYLLVQNPETEDIEGAIALANLATLPEQHLERVAEEVVHVPWCATLAYTLQLMREKLTSVASVVTEFGETMGVVLYEDLVDTVLVPEMGRTKRLLEREPVLEVAPGQYHVEGLTTLRYLCRRLGIEHEPGSDGVITVAGMLHDELEHIPVVGDECSWRGFRFQVIEVSKRTQLRAAVFKEEENGGEGRVES